MTPVPKFRIDEEVQVVSDRHRYLGRSYNNTPLEKGVVAKVTQVDAHEFTDDGRGPMVVYTLLGHYIDEDCLDFPPLAKDLARQVEATIMSLTGQPRVHDCPHCTCGMNS